MNVPRALAFRFHQLLEIVMWHYFALVNAMHITASVFINDNESGLHADYDRWLEQLAPFDPGSDPNSGGYLHNRTGEDNADAHHKRQVMGREVVVAITDGQLHLGPWEHFFTMNLTAAAAKGYW